MYQQPSFFLLKQAAILEQSIRLGTENCTAQMRHIGEDGK